MRDSLVLALAPHIGSVLTPEVARAIADKFPDGVVSMIDLSAIEPQECGSLTFQAERLVKIAKDIHPLHQAHWLETEGHRGKPMDIDYVGLFMEERAGTMIQFTARQDGRLVGIFRLLLRRDRASGRRFVREDVFYLDPACRRGRAAQRFLEYPKKALNDMGYAEFEADVMDENTPAVRLLEHRGFQRVPQSKYILKEDGHVIRS